jgi:uncharacterized protein YihD (DUF1040 family)
MKLQSINESKVTLKQFLQAVNSYSNLDDALENLPEEYIEFYLNNMNNKDLNKNLKKLKLIEAEDFEVYDTRTTTVSPQIDKFKKIHYKGEYIILKYDPRWGWIPAMTFRSITQATKYIKKLADDFMD